MLNEKETNVEAVRGESPHAQPGSGRYEPPRVVKSRRLTEVTGQGQVVPSGAPLPQN